MQSLPNAISECPNTRTGIHIDTIKKCLYPWGCGHHHCAVCGVCIRCNCLNYRPEKPDEESEEMDIVGVMKPLAKVFSIAQFRKTRNHTMSEVDNGGAGNGEDVERTSAGDPIAPNRASSGMRTGVLNDFVGGAINVVDVTTNAVANGLQEVLDAGGDIGGASIDRINDLKSQLLEELNKAQQHLV